MAMTAAQHRATTNRETRRRDRRRGNTLTHVQRNLSTWVGRRRYAFGIRSSHPWATWPLRRIVAADFMQWGDLRTRHAHREVQVALKGYGVSG